MSLISLSLSSPQNSLCPSSSVYSRENLSEGDFLSESLGCKKCDESTHSTMNRMIYDYSHRILCTYENLQKKIYSGNLDDWNERVLKSKKQNALKQDKYIYASLEVMKLLGSIRTVLSIADIENIMKKLSDNDDQSSYYYPVEIYALSIRRKTMLFKIVCKNEKGEAKEIVLKKFISKFSSDCPSCERRLKRLLQREISVLKKPSNGEILSHENIGKMSLGSVTSIFMPFYQSDDDLMKVLEGCKSLDQRVSLSKDISIGVAKGLQFLHENDIVHGDLKPGNICYIITENGAIIPKIIDFDYSVNKTGINRYFRNRIQGTPGYIAPEILWKSKSNPVTEKIDIFALGLIMAYYSTGEEMLSQYVSGPKLVLKFHYKNLSKNFRPYEMQDRTIFYKMSMKEYQLRMNYLKTISGSLKWNSSKRPNAIKLIQSLT